MATEVEAPEILIFRRNNLMPLQRPETSDGERLFKEEMLIVPVRSLLRQFKPYFLYEPIDLEGGFGLPVEKLDIILLHQKDADPIFVAAPADWWGSRLLLNSKRSKPGYITIDVLGEDEERMSTVSIHQSSDAMSGTKFSATSFCPTKTGEDIPNSHLLAELNAMRGIHTIAAVASGTFAVVCVGIKPFPLRGRDERISGFVARTK